MKQATSKPQESATGTKPPPPKNMPPELLPLFDWWLENGRQLIVTVVLALVVGGSVIGYRTYTAKRSAAINRELMAANGIEELEDAVAKYGSSKPGNAIRMRLAKAYFDAERYNDALETYETCIARKPPRSLEDVALIGRAYTLEALNQLDDANKAYQEIAANSTSFAAAQATMGMARIQTLKGDKESAKNTLENLKATLDADNTQLEMAIAHLEGVVDRYEPRTRRSLMDAADEAAQQIQGAAATDTPISAPASSAISEPARIDLTEESAKE